MPQNLFEIVWPWLLTACGEIFSIVSSRCAQILKPRCVRSTKMPVCSSKHCASSCCVIIIIILFIIIMHCASLESNRSQTIRCQIFFWLNQVFMKEIGTSRLVTKVNRNHWCNIFVSQVSFIFKHQSSKQCGMKEDWWTCAQNILIFFQIYNTENLFVTLLLKNSILFPITSVNFLAAV